jgi:hypothetical protein
MEKEALIPEELVLAVLHKVGTGIRIVDDVRLARIFNDASQRYKGQFSPFGWHPQYRYSKVLTDAFQALDHGGSIQRDNPASTYFSITPHTAGPYGTTIFEKLDDEEQRAVVDVAEQIRKIFGTA